MPLYSLFLMVALGLDGRLRLATFPGTSLTGVIVTGPVGVVLLGTAYADCSNICVLFHYLLCRFCAVSYGQPRGTTAASVALSAPGLGAMVHTIVTGRQGSRSYRHYWLVQ